MKPQRACWTLAVCVAILFGVGMPLGMAQQTRNGAGAADDTDYDRIIEDFIQYDIGKIRDRAAIERIRSRFAALQADEAVPALVRGLNKATRMRASCPITALAGKLNSILHTSQDPDVGSYVLRSLEKRNVSGYTHHITGVFNLAEQQVIRLKGKEYAREQLQRRSEEDAQRLAYVPGMKLTDLATREPGSGAAAAGEADTGGSRDGRAATGRRKSARPAAASAADLSALGVAELAGRLTDRAAQTKVLEELHRRASGDDATAVGEQADAVIRVLKDGDTAARESAARLLGLVRSQKAAPPLIEALDDANPQLRSTVSNSLARITRQLFGPSENATPAETAQAIARWRAWLAQQKSDAEGSGSDR